MSELDAWVAAATAELGLEAGDVDSTTVLNVARDVAHQVLRPGAPLTAYLMGVAVGRGADPADAATRISALAATWSTRSDAATGPQADMPHGGHTQRAGAGPAAQPAEAGHTAEIVEAGPVAEVAGVRPATTSTGSAPRESGGSAPRESGGSATPGTGGSAAPKAEGNDASKTASRAVGSVADPPAQ